MPLRLPKPISSLPPQQHTYIRVGTGHLEMGSCVSVQKSSSASGSTVKLVAFHAKRDKLVTPASPVKDDASPATIDVSPPIDSGHRDSGNREEMFFDSAAWLDSDCEDDFLSVDGDFTPSRGTTPVHHQFSIETETPRLREKRDSSVSVTKLSPTDNKKRLVELFRETIEDDVDRGEAAKARTCLWLPTPLRSSAPTTPCDSHRTVNGGYGIRRSATASTERQHRRVRSAAHGCVPRLVSCSSFTERRRKMMSPTAVSVDGKP